MLQHAEFLSYVRAYVETHPDAAAYVSDFVAEGLRRAAAVLKRYGENL